MERTTPARVRRFLLVGGVVLAALYALIYFPYGGAALPARLLGGYLRLEARVAGGLLALFDRTVSVRGDLIEGRFPLRIVLDCAALDAQAVFAAAVVAFPAPWPRKLKGLGAGLLVISLFNLVRIAFLYVVGARWPASFRAVHEEVMPVLLVVVVCGAFALWGLRPGSARAA
jgi:exosortase/archaeosortase family protein